MVVEGFFDRPWDTAVISLCQVFAGERPVLLVTHDDDGDWQFLDGSDDPAPKTR